MRLGAVDRRAASRVMARMERTWAVTPCPSAGNSPLRAAVPTVKPVAPASATALTRSALSMLPATITGLAEAAHTARMSAGTSPSKR